MLIRGGRVVTASGERDADVLVRDGTIAEVRPGLAASQDVIDAAGLLGLACGVEPHPPPPVATRGAISTTYRDTIFYADDWTWYRLMERSGEAGFLVQVHAENDAIVEGMAQQLIDEGKRSLKYHALARPAVAEAEAVGRGLLFS